MKKKNRAGVVLILAGFLLIGAAGLLYWNNQQEDAQAGQQADAMVQDIEALIAASNGSEGPAEPAEGISEGGPAYDEVAMRQGYEYLGIVEIPAIERRLPVMADWDYERLKYAPCRHFGTVEEGNLVIAGHNYNKHFGYLARLRAGDQVFFTDLEGRTASYAVEAIKRMNPEDVDAVQNSGYDLVLYTCTLGGTNRTTVFCRRTD